jgi:hypothetical protein
MGTLDTNSANTEEHPLPKVEYVASTEARSYTPPGLSTETRVTERQSVDVRFASMSKELLGTRTHIVTRINVVADAVRRTIRELNRQMRED